MIHSLVKPSKFEVAPMPYYITAIRLFFYLLIILFSSSADLGSHCIMSLGKRGTASQSLGLL